MSLDGGAGAWHSVVMLPDPLHLYRRDAALNMARFYALSVERDLFGDWVLLRHWGRIGQVGRQRAERFEDRDAAEAACARTLRAKQRRGYGLGAGQAVTPG